MRRNVSLEEISDGKLYGLNDMVKADCQDCKGCCDCCTGMGDSVILDPLDVHRLSVNLGKTPEKLMGKRAGAWSVRRKYSAAPFYGRKRGEMCVFKSGGKMLYT